MKKILAFLGIIFLSFLLISCVQKTNDSGKVSEKPKTDQPVTPNESGQQGGNETDVKPKDPTTGSGGSEGQAGSEDVEQPVTPNEGKDQGSSESSKDKELKDFLTNEETEESTLENHTYKVPKYIHRLHNLNFVPALTGKLIVHEGVNEFSKDIFDNVNFDVELLFNDSNMTMSKKWIFGVTDKTKEKIRMIRILDGVTEIPKEFARYSSYLESVIIPDSVAVIGYHAFKFTNLTYVELPKNVKFKYYNGEITDNLYNSFDENVKVVYREN